MAEASDQATSVCSHCDRVIPFSNIDLHYAHHSRGRRQRTDFLPKLLINRVAVTLSYVTQFFKNKYGGVVSSNSGGVVSSNSGLQTLLASAQGTCIATTEVGTNTPPQDILLENSSSSGNLGLQGSVAVAGNGVGSSPLQWEHGPPEGHKVQVKGADITTTEVGTNAPQGTLLQNSSSSRNLEFKDYFYLTRDEVECPTCLEEYTVENPRITSNCNHHFHLGCIYEWMERSTTCPICLEEMKFVENM